MSRRVDAVLVVAGALVAGGLAVALTATSDHEGLRVVGHPQSPVFVLLIGWSFIGSGLVAWRDPRSGRFGALMMAVGFAWFAASLEASGDPLLFSIGRVIAPLWIGIFLHALLSFPTGRLESAAARWVVGAYYLDVTVIQLAWVLFADVEGFPGCEECPANLFLVADNPALARAILIVEQPVVGVLALGSALVLLVLRWRAATAPLRRALAPVLTSGGICVLILLVTILVEPFSPATGRVVGWLGGVAFTAVPLAFLTGLLLRRLDRSSVGDLVVELGETAAPPDLRGALSRALHDPSLQIAYWLAHNDSYVDSDGRPIVLPPAGGASASTMVEHGGRRVAAVVHDASLLQDPGLIRAVCAAAGLALANARLQAELRARLDDLRESRTRIVEAGQAERRRLERDLHDGAQQRLLSVALGLRLVEVRLAGHPAEADHVARWRSELERSLEELREVAHGIHPAVLTDHGLAVALETVVARSAVPVRLSVDADGRLPEAVEATAYYLVSEALTNTAKHARAAKATVQVVRRGELLLVEVTDDGIGGADIARGSGLRGLADRVAAVEGRFTVTSPAGGGTSIKAEIPCV
ncbi:MAG TPA: histidine kinase [Actinoplanes sp.]|nr:histidine kinase [Actinoplanes sp.]